MPPEARGTVGVRPEARREGARRSGPVKVAEVEDAGGASRSAKAPRPPLDAAIRGAGAEARDLPSRVARPPIMKAPRDAPLPVRARVAALGVAVATAVGKAGLVACLVAGADRVGEARRGVIPADRAGLRPHRGPGPPPAEDARLVDRAAGVGAWAGAVIPRAGPLGPPAVARRRVDRWRAVGAAPACGVAAARGRPVACLSGAPGPDPVEGDARIAPAKALVGLPRPLGVTGAPVFALVGDRPGHPAPALRPRPAATVRAAEVVDVETDRLEGPVGRRGLARPRPADDGLRRAAPSRGVQAGPDVRRDLEGVVAKPRAGADAILGEARLGVVAVDLTAPAKA